MSEMTDYDVLVYVDGSTESSAISKVVDDNRYYVPKIKGTAISGPVVPPKPQSTHFLTIMDSTFYKGVDSHMIFNGTVCADTSKFKIIINLPTGLIQSGGEIVRGFVIYETNKTHDNFMKINGTSWELKIPTTNDAFNLTFSSMLACPVCYLTAITTNSDGTYGDEAIFNWLVLPQEPTITAKGTEINEVVITTVGADTVDFVIHAPAAIPGDIIEISNITNPDAIVTQTLVVEEKHLDYNSICITPNYVSTSMDNLYPAWNETEQKWYNTEWSETYKTPKYAAGGTGYGAIIPFSDPLTPNIKLKAILKRNDGIQTYTTSGMNRWFKPKSLDLSVISTTFAGPTNVTLNFPPVVPQEQWDQLRDINTQDFINLYAHKTYNSSYDEIRAQEITIHAIVGEYFLVGFNDFRNTCTLETIQNYISSGYNIETTGLNGNDNTSVMFLMKYDNNTSKYIRASDFYSTVSNKIKSDFLYSAPQPFVVNSINYFSLYTAEYSNSVNKYVAVLRVYKINTLQNGKPGLKKVQELVFPSFSKLHNRYYLDAYYSRLSMSPTITISDSGTLVFFPYVDNGGFTQEALTYKFNPESEKFYVLNTGQVLDFGQYDYTYESTEYNGVEYFTQMNQLAARIRGYSYNIFNDNMTVVAQVTSPANMSPYDGGRVNAEILTNNIIIKEFKFINNEWIDQHIDAFASNLDYKYMQLNCDLIMPKKTAVIKSQDLSAEGTQIMPTCWHAASKNGKYLAKAHFRVPGGSARGLGSDSIVTIVIYERVNSAWTKIYEYDFDTFFSLVKMAEDMNGTGGMIGLDCNDYGEVFVLLPIYTNTPEISGLETGAWYFPIKQTFLDKNNTNPVRSKTFSPFILVMFKKVNNEYSQTYFSIDAPKNYANTKSPVIGDEVTTYTSKFMMMLYPIERATYTNISRIQIKYEIIDNIPVVIIAGAAPIYIDVYLEKADGTKGWHCKNYDSYSWRNSTLLYTKIQVGEPIADVPVYDPDPIPIPPIPVYGTSGIEARSGVSLGLSSDFTVKATGSNSSGQLNVSSWTGIIQVAGGTSHTVGLKKDGTVIGTGDNTQNQLNITTWTDVKKIAADWYHTVAVKNDGTCVATGLDSNGQLQVSSWTDIVDICTSKSFTMGIKSDGTIVGCGDKSYDRIAELPSETLPAGWKFPNAKKIAVGTNHSVLLTSKGTAICLGANYSSQCSYTGSTNIIDVAATEDFTVMVRSDGTVIHSGYNNGFNFAGLDNWSNIVKVAAGLSNVLGLKANGTVVQLGTTSSGQGNVSNWDLNPEI